MNKNSGYVSLQVVWGFLPALCRMTQTGRDWRDVFRMPDFLHNSLFTKWTWRRKTNGHGIPPNRTAMTLRGWLSSGKIQKLKKRDGDRKFSSVAKIEIAKLFFFLNHRERILWNKWRYDALVVEIRPNFSEWV